MNIDDLLEVPVKHPVVWLSLTILIGCVFFSILYFCGV